MKQPAYASSHEKRKMANNRRTDYNEFNSLDAFSKEVIKRLDLPQDSRLEKAITAVCKKERIKQDFIEETIKKMTEYVYLAIDEKGKRPFEIKRELVTILSYALQHDICPRPDLFDKRIEFLKSKGFDVSKVMLYPELLSENVSEVFISILQKCLIISNKNPGMVEITELIRKGITKERDELLLKIWMCMKNGITIPDMMEKPSILRSSVSSETLYAIINDLKAENRNISVESVNYTMIEIQKFERGMDSNRPIMFDEIKQKYVIVPSSLKRKIDSTYTYIMIESTKSK